MQLTLEEVVSLPLEKALQRLYSTVSSLSHFNLVTIKRLLQIYDEAVVQQSCPFTTTNAAATAAATGAAVFRLSLQENEDLLRILED